jgi:hypothetical protein
MTWNQASTVLLEPTQESSSGTNLLLDMKLWKHIFKYKVTCSLGGQVDFFEKLISELNFTLKF